MRNEKRAAVYARQNGGKIGPVVPTGLEKKTVVQLREIALDCKVKITTKMRKAQIIDAIKVKLAKALPPADTSKLTPKQQRRLRKKANREVA